MSAITAFLQSLPGTIGSAITAFPGSVVSAVKAIPSTVANDWYYCVHVLPGVLANNYHDYLHAWAYHSFNRPGNWIWLPILLYCGSKSGLRQFIIRHSSLAPHRKMKGLPGWRSQFSLLVIMSYVALGTGMVHWDMAMMGPTVPEKQVDMVIQTRDICQWDDSSGSTESEYNDGVKELDDKAGSKDNDPNALKITDGGNGKLLVQSKKKGEKPHPMNRAEAAQMAARHFIKILMTNDIEHTNRFCMWRFDTDSYIVAPLSTDKTVMLLRSDELTNNVGGGTNFGGPCAFSGGIGPLRKQYDYFLKYSAPNAVRVQILATDGYDDIPKVCRDDLVQKYKAAHIILYVIGLGDGWKKDNKLDLEKFADELHKADGNSGFVYHTANPGEITKAMDDIARLEQAQEVVHKTQIDREVDEVFIDIAIGCLIMYIIWAIWARRNP
jgi:hypothetical protein